jgi:hypothetical protein
MATWSAWRDLIHAIVNGEADPATATCPTCGRSDLRLAYLGDAAARVGFAALWSPACGTGITTGRLTIPAGHDIVSWDLPDEQRARLVPNFTTVEPTTEELAMLSQETDD